jgi:hypothetical protein
MKLFYSILFLQLSISNSFSQATINVIKSGELKFPIIELTNKRASQKINDYLQTNMLEQTTLKNPGAKLFDERKWTDSTSGIDELDYEVVINDGKILAISFSGQTEGAYPSPLVEYYQFNVQNGEVILINDILSKSGLLFFEKDVKQKRRALIEQHLLELKSEEQYKKDKEVQEDLPHIKEELIFCNENDDLDNFSLTKSGITFHKDFCLPHVIQALDADLDIFYSFNELKDKSSPFGKKLFSKAVTNISNEFLSSIKKPLYGKIGNYNIVVQLRPDIDEESGFYYYTSKGILIDLSVKTKRSDIKMKEIANDGSIRLFNGKIYGTTIKGTWTNLKTKQVLPFEVAYKKL